MNRKKFLNGVWLTTALFFVTCVTVSAADEATDPDELENLFSAGVEALERDRLRTAAEVFSSILKNNPALHRARLELARAYYLSFDYERARREVRIVLDDPNTPLSVRTTLLAFLAQIEADQKRFAERHQWAPSIYAGPMYDTNVNVGPDRDIVDIQGVQFVVTPESREQSDTAFIINPGLSHTYNPGSTFQLGENSGFFLWQSQLNGYYRAYFDADDFDLGVVTVRSGPAWVVPRHWRASIGLQVDKIWLGGSGLALFSAVNPIIAWQVGENTEFTLDTSLTQRSYDKSEDSLREGRYAQGTTFVSRYFYEKKLVVQAGIGYSRFNADAARFTHNGINVFLGAVFQAWENGSLYARAEYREYDYDGVEPIFNISRNDDEYRFTARFQHEVQSGLLDNWQILGEWIFTDNQSNVSIFNYDRHQFSLGLYRDF